MISKRTGVVLAGALVNFCLGIFYAWSVFADGLIKELGWTRAEAMLPYTLELLVFSIAMVFGGWFQGRFGPKLGIVISGTFIGISFILCAFVATPLGVALIFGFIFGAAVALGYSAVMANIISWFPPKKRGTVTGIVLMSLGVSALFWSPVVNLLISNFGIINTFVICGITQLVTINLAALSISPPSKAPLFGKEDEPPAITVNSRWTEIVREPSFLTIWLLIGISSGTGTMFIAHLVQIAELNFNIGWGYILVALFAATNAAGRMIGGVLCDRVGYRRNLKVALFMMLAAMISYLSGLGWPALILGTLLLGLSYGSLYTSYPNIIAGIFGSDNFGLTYGLAFTAVGIIGGLGPISAASLAQMTNSYYPTFIIGLLASLVCFYLLFILKHKTTA